MLFLIFPLIAIATDNGESEEYTIIEDEDIPLAPFSDEKAWALWNLIISVAGALLALMMSIRILFSKRTVKTGDSDDYNEKQERSKQIPVIVVPVLGILGILLFILTQDMRLPITMIDWWTLIHALLFAGGILSYIIVFRTDIGGDSDDEHPEVQQA